MTLYDVLGVSVHSDKKHIKKAYRDLAKKYHPDANQGDVSVEEKFKEISNAYSILSDDQERIKYDASLVNPFAGQAGFNFDGNLSDMFNQFFSANPRSRRGQDIRVTMSFTFEDAFRGGPRRVEINGQTLDINLPPGLKTGHSLRLAGKGSTNPYNQDSPAGDVIINVEVLMDSRWILRGDDVWVGVDLPWWNLVIGTQISVQTLDGSSLKVTVQPQSSAGKVLRIKGHGWPLQGSIYNSTQNSRGSMMVQLTASYPQLSDEQLELVKKLKESIDLERQWSSTVCGLSDRVRLDQ